MRPFKSEIKGLVEALRAYFYARDDHIIPKTDISFQLGMYNRRWMGNYIVNPAQMMSAVLMPNRYGGGQLRWAFLGQSYDNFGRSKVGAQWWSWSNVLSDDFVVSANGGPYIDLNGSDEYLSMADHSSQEIGADEFFVWHWCYPTTLASSMVIASKYDSGANTRSWRLQYNTGSGWFLATVNDTGLVAADKSQGSGYSESVNTWHFVAMYYQPSTLLRIYVAQPTDTSLTINSATSSIPASLYDGGAALSIGTAWNSAAAYQPWQGYIGIGAGWSNVQPSRINDFANEIFQTTRWFYQA